MSRLWKVLETPEAEIAALHATTDIPPVLLRIMWNRGLRDPVAIERFFEPRARSLTSPYLLDGIPQAVHRILQAVEREESIRVYGDRDVDGITSTVLMVETLRELTRKVDFTVPVIEDGYGLNRDYLDVAKRDGVGLIITVDCGISNLAEVEYARSLGIDVIVTDHHEPPSALPQAVAIIDPKLPGSPAAQRDMAGVGVAQKLALAVVLAQAKDLARPLIAIDFQGEEVDVVRFTPREGFSQVKHLHPQTLAHSQLLFFSPEEREALTEVLPGVKGGSPLFISRLARTCTPEHGAPAKDAIADDMRIPADCQGARRLIVMYLKFLEAMEPQVKAMWQRSLDVLTVGTVADMVPLRGENRTLAQMGLKFASNTKRGGLQQLYIQLGWKKKRISERDISFNIAPILNSSGRLRSAELAIHLLTTESATRAKELAEELFQLNLERKRLGEECYRQVKEHLLAQNDVTRARILVVNAPQPNQGVTGIVATRLMLDFCRPVIVLLEDHGKYLGSARSYKSINIMNALHTCSHLLEKYGGHVGAAGLTLPKDRIEEFRRCLAAYASTAITDADLQAEWVIDAPLPVDQVDETFLEDLLRFAPFGIENPQPLFLARGAAFYEVRKVGESKNHLRFKFRKSSGKAVYGIGFNLGGLLDQDVVTDGTCDVVFAVEPNEYNGVRSAQIVVSDVIFPPRGG
ncbi:MAG: single-stranded-DNA-specific exonuclease RecJ [Candidatus Riflebacteria bacterium]|nr:single-stranded-DNA-specific exonuclease RecJ [Candidatus Riflebacteria bacterium]